MTVLFAMVVVQLVGAWTAVHFYFRMRAETTANWYLWLALTSIIGGGTGFTAHVATLSIFDDGQLLVLDPVYVAASFCISLTVVGLALLISNPLSGLKSPLVFAIIFHTTVSIGNLGVVLTADTQGEVVISTTHIAVALSLSFLMSLLGGFLVETANGLFKASIGAIALGFMTPVQDAIFMMGLTVYTDPTAAIPSGLTMTASLNVVLICAGLVITIVGGAGLLIERKMERDAKARYRELAYTDALTGQRNRVGMNEALKDRLAFDGPEQQVFALFLFDLDRFKTINDTLGHAAGDAVLVSFSEHLLDALPPDATIGRFGGDEFVALVPMASTKDPEQEISQIAEAILRRLKEPITFAEIKLPISASIGASIAPKHAKTANDLLVAADIALYEAKKRRGSVVIYDDVIGEAAKAKTKLDAELTRALQKNEFVLYFQSQVDLKNNEVSGFETLIRWNHPEQGLLTPNNFIPHAEKSAIINEIGRWVLNEACRIAATWPDHYRISVNVAPRQLAMPDFPEQVQEALSRTGLKASRLEIELTEASVIEDEELALRVMNYLKALGVGLVMDDYGTGFASLAALRAFPFDKLKIDRSFVEGLPDDAQSAAIVRSTLVLTEALGIPVIAEGVETQDQVDFLTSEGCDNVQGFFFGRPQPAEVVQADMGLQEAGQAKRVGSGGF